MKRIISILAILILCSSGMRADEGMWLLPLLQKMNGKAIKDAGCALSPNQIYKINNGSLKDAIVQFGGGCTGEIVSDEGLLLTNHHCGYGNIQKLSTVEHDYLKDGYWAMRRSEELPCEGLTVTFLQYMEDLGPILEKAEKKARSEYKGSADIEEQVQKAQDAAVKDAVAKAEKKDPHCTVKVTSFYNDNVYYLIVYKIYRDIRFVGAPPSSIGKFGADSDNWMWPRHTGDFSMFRVYADKDNNPADYSPENVPLNVKNPLKVSTAGIQEGDFTMIMGYPGRTTRFQTSPELKFQLEQNDIRIAARTVRQNVLLEDMLADPKVKIQYASKYASSSNGWKKWQGMKLAFEKLDIISRAEKQEAEFRKWVSADRKGKRQAKYDGILDSLSIAIENGREANLAFTKAFESVYKIELTSFAKTLERQCARRVRAGKDTLTALNMAFEVLKGQYADYSVNTDRKVAKAMMKYYRDNAAPEDYLKDLPEDFATMDIDAFVDRMFDESDFVSAERLEAAIMEKGAKVLDDPACVTGLSILNECIKLQNGAYAHEGALEDARRTYTAGLLEWKEKTPMYPDANFTMRFTYGSVKGYSPKDAVIYRYYTTLKGVMEKENPENWEFVVPGKLKYLYETKDFGPYAMADGQMPVAFLSTNDITGGNSGSPIMNAHGELIGLAFDGNWESMSSDVMFEPELQRCINVDIRYVLFIIDKFGGAGHLVDEMDIVSKRHDSKK
ncbi:MAG: S46 family peptidase [Bacteroidales bacterium]|nr:S46 family peptidase [Bacteroidales bacterium]